MFDGERITQDPRPTYSLETRHEWYPCEKEGCRFDVKNGGYCKRHAHLEAEDAS